MRLRIIPYKMGSRSAKVLSKSLTQILDYEVEVGNPSSENQNVSWGYHKDNQVDLAWINTPKAVQKARDKLETLKTLESLNIPHVPFTTDLEVVNNWLSDNSIVFARSRYGQQGKDIVIVWPGEDIPQADLYTKYIRKKAEYRVHVFKGDVIQVQQKRRKLGVVYHPLIRNASNGWVFCLNEVNPNEAVLDYAKRAISGLELDFGAVDIIWSKQDKAYVLEVNTAPGLAGSTINRYTEAFKNVSS